MWIHLADGGFLIRILLIILFFGLADSTLSKNDKKGVKKKTKSPDDKINSNWEENNIENDLREEILSNNEILDIDERKFLAPTTLGYVTVWNNHGYDVAKWAAKKFTHISPVWFQLKSAQIDGQMTCKIEGTHDIDMGWIEDIRKNNSNAKIVPRFLFEGWNGNELKQFLFNEQTQYRCVRAIIGQLLRNEMNGAVMEIWLQIMAMTRGTAVEYLLELVEFWAHEFHKAGLIFILPMTPPLNEHFKEIGIVNRDLVNRLVNSVDYINIMTYDFSSSEIYGIAPINWVQANIQYFLDSIDNGEDSSKILMGLNFYGYDRTGGANEAILGKKFIEILSKPNSILNYDPEAAEYRLNFDENGIIYFPTTRSIQIRLDLAKKLNIGGVAIWDLGQGLNHFTSML